MFKQMMRPDVDVDAAAVAVDAFAGKSSRWWRSSRNSKLSSDLQAKQIVAT